MKELVGLRYTAAQITEILFLRRYHKDPNVTRLLSLRLELTAFENRYFLCIHHIRGENNVRSSIKTEIHRIYDSFLVT